MTGSGVTKEAYPVFANERKADIGESVLGFAVCEAEAIEFGGGIAHEGMYCSSALLCARGEPGEEVLRWHCEYEKAPSPIIHMRIPCPACGELHIDEGEWATKEHHTHACQSCGLVWRPAIQPTCGVRFLPGLKNEEPNQ